MHYVPESSRDFLPRDDSAPTGPSRGIHYQSAPLYLLTAAVGGLLLADVLASLTGAFSVSILGYRWALWGALLGGARILYHTLDDLLSGRIGAGLALTIAFVAAVWLGEVMTAGLVVFITLCGEYVERYTIDLAQAAVRNVFDLYPATARVQRDGREQECPLSELEIGDLVVIRPGERLPADGIVRDGVSSVDQSALTGESGPIEKSPGDEVFAGTLNRFGAMTVSVTRTGSGTLLGQVTETVAEAARHKTASERTADRLARLFLPVVLTVAAMTYFGWWLATGDSSAGWLPMLGVLVVACPCALVLATPTAVMASLAWLARSGIVVKGSDALERLAEVDAFVFDKTGTLTRGELAIATVRPTADNLSPELLLYLIAAIEQQSEHPLAEPFAEYARKQNWQLPAVQQFSAAVGGGVSARVSAQELGKTWSGPGGELFSSLSEPVLRTGNLQWLQKEGAEPTAAVRRLAGELDERGESALFLAVDDVILGAVGLKDSVREEAGAVLSALKQLGIGETALLTGDRKAAAEAVVSPLGGMDGIQSDLLPGDKARWIKQRQAEGHRLAMVGDGINDAPALAASDVGIAVVHRQSNLAAEAGDLLLLSGSLKPLPGLIRLSRALVRNIRQSIVLFAFGLNGLGMLLCAVGLLSPVMGAVFHELGSLAVMVNALRLLWFEPTSERKAAPAGRASAIAEWLTTAFSPSRWVYRFVDHWNVLLRLSATAIVLGWLFSNVVFLSHDERALVTRFGKVHSALGTGWHWRWPAPLERVYRERPEHLRTLTYGFRSTPLPEGESRPAVIDWTSPHEQTGEQPIPEESLLLTADEVPVELAAEVHYRIADLQEFLFGNSDPEKSLRALTGQSLRSLAATTSLDEILTVGREELERDCLEQLRKQSADWGMGIEIMDVQLIEVHPPRSVVPAYRDVANALEERELQKNQAQAAAASRLLETVGPRALEELKHSLNWDFQTPLEQPPVLNDDNWKAVAQSQEETGSPRLEFLAGESADVLLDAKGNAIGRRESARGKAERFQLLLPVYREHPELTSIELYWKTLEAVLPGKPFTILDPKAVGRKHLFLGGKDAMEFPPPPMFAPSLSAPEPGRAVE